MNHSEMLQELEPSVMFLGTYYGLSLVTLIMYLMP